MPEDIPTSPVTLEQYAAMEMAERRKVWLEISDITEAEFEGPRRNTRSFKAPCQIPVSKP